jgi:hypothetical protein
VWWNSGPDCPGGRRTLRRLLTAPTACRAPEEAQPSAGARPPARKARSVLYLANPCGNPAITAAMRAGDLGYIDTPKQGNTRPAGVLWCADNRS